MKQKAALRRNQTIHNWTHYGNIQKEVWHETEIKFNTYRIENWFPGRFEEVQIIPSDWVMFWDKLEKLRRNYHRPASISLWLLGRFKSPLTEVTELLPESLITSWLRLMTLLDWRILEAKISFSTAELLNCSWLRSKTITLLWKKNKET